MAILSEQEAKSLLTKVLSYSKADHCEVSLRGSNGGNIRYARNAVSTAGEMDVMSISVSSTFGKKTGSASINEFDEASLEKVVRRAEELAKLAPENPEYMPPLGPQSYLTTPTFDEQTAKMDASTRADMVAESLTVAKQANLEAAGFLENSTRFQALLNSANLFAYNRSTGVDFSVTMRNKEGTGSGYVEQGFNKLENMRTKELSEISANKANTSAGARALEPGKYTVILEPLAASDMLSYMFRGFDARNADEGRSFMSKPGGGTRLGEQLFSDNVTIYSDPMNPEVPSASWSSEGVPLKRTEWVKNGVVQNLSYSRYWADQKGVEPLPFNRSIVFEGGNESLEEMIRSTERGILVTRFWYIRSVDPQTLLLTGLTRDGTFYIENGQIMYPIKNFRFNESPVIMLNNVEALGKPVRTASGLVPPMKINEFTFTSLSDAI